MLDSMNLKYGFATIQNACESKLPNSKFFERTAGEGFEVIGGFSPLGFDYVVEFRRDSILCV